MQATEAPSPWTRTDWLALGAILLTAFALRVACAIYLPNASHTDEIFQYIEPAHRAVYGYGIVTWEFKLGGRSWLVPGFVAAIMLLVAPFSDSPAVYLGAVGVVMSLLSLSIVAVAYVWGRRIDRIASAVITAALAACWIELIYLSPKPLMDTFSAFALILALALVYPEGGARARKAYLLCGFFLGLGFAFRFHNAPMYALVALWVCRLELKERWLPLAAGAVVPVIAAGLLDWITWDYPFQSMWIPLWRQIQGVTYSVESTEPFYYYIGILTLNWSGAIAALAILAIIGAFRMPLLAVLVIVSIAVYSLIGVKVYRYIFPAVTLYILLAGIGASSVVRWLGKQFPKYRTAFAAVAVISWGVTSASLAVGEHFRTFLTKDAAILRAFLQAGRQPDLCGLGVTGMDWWRTPGYTYLHRDVPIYMLPAQEIATRAESFNYLIGPRNAGSDPVPFARQSCAPNAAFNPANRVNICVYRRPGTCTASAERRMEDQLK